MPFTSATYTEDLTYPLRVYRMLRWGRDYLDQGEEAYERRHRQRRLLGIAAAANSLGYQMIPLEETHTATL